LNFDKIYLLAILPIPMWLTVNFIVIYARNKNSLTKIKQIENQNFDYIQKDLEIKYYWRRGMKDYISFITNCDIYFHKDYFVVAPYQNFPFKAYHSPVKFKTSTNLGINSSLFFTIDKLELNKFNKKEIELHYSEGHNMYRIKFKNLYKTIPEKLELMKNYS
jgi:hypothetical protein